MSYVENNFSQISLSFTHKRKLTNSLWDPVLEAARVSWLPYYLFIAIHSSAGFPSLGSADILDPIPCCGGCPVSWVLFSSVPGLCPVDAVSTPTKVLITKMSPNWEPVLKGKAKLLYQKKPNQMQWLKKDRIFSLMWQSRGRQLCSWHHLGTYIPSSMVSTPKSAHHHLDGQSWVEGRQGRNEGESSACCLKEHTPLLLTFHWW